MRAWHLSPEQCLPSRERAVTYDRNYSGGEEPEIVEMVQVAPFTFVRRDVAERLGLRIVEN